MVTRNKLWTAAAVGSLLFSTQASAAEIERNTAQMQAMDKITGRVSVIDVPVNSEVQFFHCGARLQNDASGRNARKLCIC